MTGLIELGLGIAGSTLSEIIKELVTGKKKAARMAEIEHEVVIQLEKRSYSQNEQNERILKIALEEFSKLVEHNPGLKFSGEQVELKRHFEVPFFSPKISTEEELKTLLEQLNVAISARRQELSLTMQSGKDVPPNSVSNINDATSDSPIEWIQVREKEVDSPIALEIKKMQDRIYYRRSKEALPDEQ
jgi:hypothetical protein